MHCQMSLLSDLKGPLLGTVTSVVLFVVLAMVGVVEGLTALTRPGGGLVALLDALLPYLVGLFLVGVVGVGFVVWGLYRVAKGVVDTDSRLIRNEKVATLAAYVERESDVARQFDIAERVGPTEQERRERERKRLEEQYVAGELSEDEFERRLGELLDDGDDVADAASERSTPQREYSR